MRGELAVLRYLGDDERVMAVRVGSLAVKGVGGTGQRVARWSPEAGSGWASRECHLPRVARGLVAVRPLVPLLSESGVEAGPEERLRSPVGVPEVVAVYPVGVRWGLRRVASRRLAGTELAHRRGWGEPRG